jgi:antitoxin HicB
MMDWKEEHLRGGSLRCGVVIQMPLPRMTDAEMLAWRLRETIEYYAQTTKRETLKSAAYYMSLPYTTVLRLDEAGDFVAHVQELPRCSAHGKDRAEALDNLQIVQRAWIEECLESNQPIPEPEPEEDLPSGKWVQRVPRTLHKALSELAKKEEVSLNQLVTSMLLSAATARSIHSGNISRYRPFETKTPTALV